MKTVAKIRALARSNLSWEWERELSERIGPFGFDARLKDRERRKERRERRNEKGKREKEGGEDRRKGRSE